MSFPERILFIYEAVPRAIGLYFEKAFKQLNYDIVTCDIKNDIRTADIICKADQDLTDIISQINPQPDIIIYFESRNLFPKGWEKITQPKIWYSTEGDVHLKDHEEIVDFFDILFSSNYAIAKHYKSKGYLSYWLPLAVDPDIHHPLKRNITHDIAFVGTLNMVQYRSRAQLLQTLQEYFKVNIVTRATPQECAEIYASSHLVFDKSLGLGINTRPFETLACQRLLLTEKNPESGIELLFEDHQQLLYYQTSDQLVKLVNVYLEDKTARESIALQGYEEVIKYHTYQHRVRELIGIISQVTSCGLNLPATKFKIEPFELALKYATLYCHNYMLIEARHALKNFENSGEAQSLLALSYFLERQPSLALSHMQKALETLPHHLEWLYFATCFAFANGDYQKAIEYLERIKTCAKQPILYPLPGHLTSLLGSMGMEGAIYYFQQKYQETIVILTQTLKNNSYHQDARWYIYYLLSHSYFHLNQFNQAEQTIRQALQENAYYEKSYLLLADIYIMTKQPDLSLQILEQGRHLLEACTEIEEMYQQILKKNNSC